MLVWHDVWGNGSKLISGNGENGIDFHYEITMTNGIAKPTVHALGKHMMIAEPWQRLTMEDAKTACENHFTKFVTVVT